MYRVRTRGILGPWKAENNDAVLGHWVANALGLMVHVTSLRVSLGQQAGRARMAVMFPTQE